MNNLQINSSGMEKLGLALHTFQDVNAHQGAVFHPSWHGGLFDGILSRHNEHSLWNDIFPELKAYKKAMFMTKSAVLVHQALTGDFSNFKNKSTLYTEGMSKDQYDQLSNSLDSGGFTIQKGEDGTSIVTKKK